jgi:hypothetical protein
MDIEGAIESTCDLFSYEFSRSGVYNSAKCFNLLSKLVPVVVKYPQLFLDKTILDFGSGQGEHSFFLSHFAKQVSTFDPVKSNALSQFRIFYDYENIKVLRHKNECFGEVDTFLAISLLHLIENPINWITDLSNQIKADTYIFILKAYEEEDSIKFVDKVDYDKLFNRQTEFISIPSPDHLFDTLVSIFSVERFDFKDYLGSSRVALILNKKVD